MTFATLINHISIAAGPDVIVCIEFKILSGLVEQALPSINLLNNGRRGCN